jgi:type II protein arginine methyltransferase
LKPFTVLQHLPLIEGNEASAHLMYIRYLHENLPPLSKLEEFAMGYQDYLQTPLQPLEFNLESATYEIFEKDPVKYGNYGKAIELALKDQPADKKMYSRSTARLMI